MGHDDKQVYGLVVTQNGTKIISVDMVGLIKGWVVKSHQPVEEWKDGLIALGSPCRRMIDLSWFHVGKEVCCIAFSPDKDKLANKWVIS